METSFWTLPCPRFWWVVLGGQGFLFFLRYLLLAGLAQAFLSLRGEKLGPARLYPDGPRPGQRLREFGRSPMTFLVFGLTGAASFSGVRLGYTQLYREVHLYGTGYLIFSLILLALFHDASFLSAPPADAPPKGGLDPQGAPRVPPPCCRSRCTLG